MPVIGSGHGVDRQALAISPATTVANAGTASIYLRAAGLPKVTCVVHRTVNAATDLTIQFFGQVGNDSFLPLGPTTAIPAAAVGQVVRAQIDGSAHEVVRATIAWTNGAGDTTVSLQLMATWT